MSEIDDIRMKAFRRIVKECGPVLLIDGNTEEAMSTTNDTPGKYGDQPKREPMLSDDFVPNILLTNFLHELLDNFDDELRNTPDYSKRKAWHEKRVAQLIERFLPDIYKQGVQAKIQRGELIVVKTTKFEDRNSFIHCTTCGWNMAWEAEGLCDKFKSCPGCTAKIIDG